MTDTTMPLIELLQKHDEGDFLHAVRLRQGWFNGRIEYILQSHRFRSGEDLEQTILCYVRLYNGQLPQPVLKGRTPIDALRDWHRERPELFRKQPYNHTRCDT